MRKLLLFALLLAMICALAAAGAAGEALRIYLTFSDGTRAEARPVPDQADWYTVSAGETASLDGVLFEIAGGDAAAYAPQSGSTVSLPFCTAALSASGYLPVNLLDAQGQVVRQIRLYAVRQDDDRGNAEEAISLYAVLAADTALTDAQGNTHLLSGTLAKDTVVHVIAVRRTDRGTLYRIDLNGEVAYLPAEAVTVSQEDQSLIVRALSGVSFQEDSVSFAVTTYEAGLRSGKGNNDRNLIARIPKDNVLMVFSELTDDDGKLLDLVYFPELQAMGYVHDSQLRHLSQEEATALLAPPQDQEGSAQEFVDGTVSADTFLYAFPDKNSKTVAELKRGQQVFLFTRIEGAGDSWYLAQAGEALGYLNADSAAPLEEKNSDGHGAIRQGLTDDEALQSKYALVEKAEILLYESPSLTGGCLTRLYAGELLIILNDITGSDGQNWLYVRCDKGEGYVLADQADRVMINSYLLSQPNLTKEGDR